MGSSIHIVSAAVDDRINQNRRDLGIPMQSRYFNRKNSSGLVPRLPSEEEFEKPWVSQIQDSSEIPRRLAAGSVIAGVMLLNMKRWRAERISDQVFTFLINNKVRFLEQDALNAILHNWRITIDSHWNQISLADELKLLKNDPQQLMSYFREAMIVHFASDLKPWQYASLDPRRYLYLSYLEETPWRNIKHSDVTVINVLKKIAWKYLPEFLNNEGAVISCNP